MKKFLLLALSLLMLIPMLSVMAFAGPRAVIEGEGLIGAIDPDGIISVAVPNDFVWFVTEDSYLDPAKDDVFSTEYEIVNKCKNATLEVTLVSFEQVDGPTIPDGVLTLNFTGAFNDPAAGIGDDIVGYTNGTTPFTDELPAGSTWTFGFGGTYADDLPVNTILNPKYTMELNFKVVRISGSN